MKMSGLKSLWLIAVAAVIAGCADSASEDVPGKCEANVCKDNKVLNECVDGVFQETECRFGCANDACVVCTASYCADNMTLAKCENNTISMVPCPNGCENNACKDDPGGACVQSVCKDSNVLLQCDNGVQTEITCPYGCDGNACKSACTEDVCKDDNTLSMCNDGVSTDVPCPLGCAAGKCNTASCTADFCRDDSILMVCVNGQAQAVPCPYGCSNNQCNTAGETCTEGAKQCNGNNLLTCKNNAWSSEPCANGCENNACKTNGEVVVPTPTGGKLGDNCDANTYVEGCNGQVVQYCYEGKVDEVDCSASAGVSCHVLSQDGNAYADCFDDSMKCNNPGEKGVEMCYTYGYYGDITFTHNCYAATDGGAYYTIDWDADYEMCDGSCNTEGTACGEGTVVTGDYEICGSDCTLQSTGQSCTDYCKSKNSSSICVLDSEGYIECSDPCTADTVGSIKNHCEDYTSYDYGYILFDLVCTQVGSSYAYITNFDNYDTCPNGCNADNSGCAGGTPTTCTNGMLQCNGNRLEVCSGGSWTLQENCANGCENNACKDAPTTCTSGSLQCNGNRLELCVNGSWTLQENCANGCENNACKDAPATCTNDDLQCNGNRLEVCSGGAWTLKENCANGCENKACKDAPATCTNDDLQCNGNDLQICSNNAWVLKETCANGCENKACKASVVVPDPTGGNVGDNCDDTYVEGCDGQVVMYCNSSSKIASLDCSAQAGFSCHVLSKNGEAYANCYDDSMKCTTPGEKDVNLCYEYGSYGEITFSHQCYPATDGSAYYEIDWDGAYERCDHGCNNDGTACGELEFELCGSDCTLQSGGTCVEYCQAQNSSSVCVLDSDGYIECSDPCTASKVGDVKNSCVDYSSDGLGYILFDVVCTKVGSSYAYITDYDNYSTCDNGCNAAGTGCK